MMALKVETTTAHCAQFELSSIVLCLRPSINTGNYSKPQMGQSYPQICKTQLVDGKQLSSTEKLLKHSMLHVTECNTRGGTTQNVSEWTGPNVNLKVFLISAAMI